MSELPKDKKEKKDKPRPKKSETIPIPDPPVSNSVSPSRPPPGFGAEPPSISVGSRQNRTYSVEQLLTLQDDPKLQQPAEDLKLPDKINRKLLEPALRKRKYPFITENGRRKNGDGNQSWGNQKGKWRDNQRTGKGRKDATSIDEIEEVEETDEQRDPNEPEPDWADADPENIKREIRSYQFQALDREAEREMFAMTGQVPDKPKLAKIQKVDKKATDEGNLDSLFRKAKTANLPQLPENAVDANQLEKGQVPLSGSLFSSDLRDKARDDSGPARPLGQLFDFAGRDLNRSLGRSPIGDHLGRRDEYGVRAIGDRALGGDPRRSPNTPGQEREEGGRIGDFDLNKFADPGSAPDKTGSSTPPDADQGMSDRDRTYPASKTINVKSKMDPAQRLENILYEVTDPVRPCVGGQFFAPARPLTNKELYDYSPKFKEIQDTRHKQMMQHSMRQQRKRIMMEKYAQAKRMYEKYPTPHSSRGMGHPDKMYDHRRMMDYRSREPGYPSDYDYMKRSQHRPGPADPIHYQ